MIKALMFKGEADSLKYLDNDIKQLKRAFRNINIEVEEVSGDKFVVLQKLSEITDQLGSTDTLIVYYTGHGFPKQGKINFKLGTGSKNADYLSIVELIENTSNAKVNSVVLILDCCYAMSTTVAWKDYASDNHVLFLPSGDLEPVEEIEEYQMSFFTHCILKALEDNSEDLYEENKITLNNLYNVTRKNAIQYNKEKAVPLSVPELFGGRRKDIILGYSKKQPASDKQEERIEKYLMDFVYCMENCDKSCNEEKIWCTTIFKSEADVYKYVIPTVKEFITNPCGVNVRKINLFFDSWLRDQANYLGLLGEMGVGKTTACVYLFYFLSKKYLEKQLLFVPVFIPLSHLNEKLKSATNIYSVIKYFSGEAFTIKDIQKMCRQRRMVFILDGFDEISGDSSTSTIIHNYNNLKRLMRFNCKTVLTCRTHYFSEQDQLEEVLMGRISGTDFAASLLSDEYPFNVVELQEFTETEILELIALLVPGEDNTKIWQNIADIYDLKDLAKRAILLKMIVNTLPELQGNKSKIDSVTLYLVYTQKLLLREIESRKIGMDISEKENFMGYIANLMFINEELVIQSARFNKEIKQYFEKSVYSIDELNNKNYDCRVSTFFSRDYQDNYHFMHKSFYEFYFAMYCIRQMQEEHLESWKTKWFSREIAQFIKGLIEKKYKYLILNLIQISITTKDEILIWNTLHILSLLEKETVESYFTESIKQEYIKKGYAETRSVIIRQYCRIIAKFIDRKCAEELIDKIIDIVRSDQLENEANDQTYYNYYGGKKAACQAFIKHLSVTEPKYDAKLHLYLLEHIASKEYSSILFEITQKWISKELYDEQINIAICEMEKRNE